MVTAYVPIKNRLDSLLSRASGGPDHGREANHHDFFSGRGPVPKFQLLVQKEGINRGFLSGPFPRSVILTLKGLSSRSYRGDWHQRRRK